MMQPLVSIIITCYNQATLIYNAIESVLNQTYANWECLIIDDGSTDNSAEAIKEYTLKDNRIKYYYTTNIGVAQARNLGYSKSKGTYINFLDGDDWFHPKKIELQIEFFNRHQEFDVCYVKHQYFIEKTKQFKTFSFEILEKEPLHQFLHRWHKGVAFPQHSALYRKNIWKDKELPFPLDYHKREEDWVFNVLNALRGLKYGYINETLCTYYIGESNFTSSMLNTCINTIEAAIYLNAKLPPSIQETFISNTIKNTIIRYSDHERINHLKSSLNWRIGNFLTLPIGKIYKQFRRKQLLNKTPNE